MKSLIFFFLLLVGANFSFAKRETPYLRSLYSQASVVGIAYALDSHDTSSNTTEIDLRFLKQLKGPETEKLILAQPKIVPVDDPQIRPGELKLVFIEVTSGKPTLIHASPVSSFKVNLRQVKCSPSSSCGELSLDEVASKEK